MINIEYLFFIHSEMHLNNIVLLVKLGYLLNLQMYVFEVVV